MLILVNQHNLRGFAETVPFVFLALKVIAWSRSNGFFNNISSYLFSLLILLALNPVVSFLFLSLLLFFVFFWPWHMACGILVPWPGIEPASPAVEAQTLNHWTTSKVPSFFILFDFSSIYHTPSFSGLSSSVSVTVCWVSTMCWASGVQSELKKRKKNLFCFHGAFSPVRTPRIKNHKHTITTNSDIAM